MIPERVARWNVAVFIAALALGAFDAGSYVYLRAQSTDFVLAHRENVAFPYELGREITWQNEAPAATSGWWSPSPLGTWSVEPSAALKVRLSPRPVRDLTFTALLRAFMDGRIVRSRDVEVWANGTRVDTWRFVDTAPVSRTATIPVSLVPPDGVLRIELRIDTIGSPSELGISTDNRRLGIMMHTWRIDQQP